MSKIVSPCIDRCSTNGNFCPSCGRTEQEIQDSWNADNETKQKLIAQCTKRLDSEAFDYWEEQYEYKQQDG